MHGFRQGEEYIRKELSNYDICCIQEHWLYPSALSNIINISNEYDGKAVSIMIDDDVMALGRPKGGLAILWKKVYNSSVRYIGSSLNGRIMAVILKCKSTNICLFNVYLPCFEYSDEYSVDLMECVAFIELVIDQHKNVGDGFEFCIIGDFNIDIERIFNSNKASVLKSFLRDYKLNIVTKELEKNGAYTFHNDALKIFSMIDHCAVTEYMATKVNGVNIIEHVDDWSDHKPIEVMFNMTLEKQDYYKKLKQLKANWSESAKKQYYENTRNELYNVVKPVCDKTEMCGDSGHRGIIEKYCNNIIQALNKCTLWKNREFQYKSSTVRWNANVDFLKKTAKLHYKMWVDGGSIKNSQLYDNMMQSKKAYKNEIKNIKLLEKEKKNKYIETLLENKDVRFWREWRKIKARSSSCNNSSSNDHKMANRLVNEFSKKFIDSRNNKILLDEFLKKYDELAFNFNKENNSKWDEFSVYEIERAVNDLNLKRTGDKNGLEVEHVLNSHPIIYVHLKLLFNLILKHGYVPSDFKEGMIIPVLKDKMKDNKDIENYRPITIISMLSKIFEMCLYKRMCCKLQTDGMQYGYVKEGGCEKCIFAVTNVTNYFLQRKSDVFIVTLDASAAFDKVNIYGLLTKLIDCDISYDIIRVLLSWYGNSRACVRLGGCLSDYIDIRSGIKQGGLMSPLMYNIYVNDLMKKLKVENLGCNICNEHYGTIFYADDVVLLSGSARNMQKMINICYDYGVKFGICFNPRKTKWMCTNVYSSIKNVSFNLNGVEIVNDHSIAYLGVKLIMKKSILTIDVDDRIKKFNMSAYSVLINTKDLSEVLKCEIIIKKCLPVLLYGIGGIDVSDNDVYKMHISYRKIFRYIFQLSLRSPITELLDVFGIVPLKDNICKIRESVVRRNLSSRFYEISMLTSYVVRDE